MDYDREILRILTEVGERGLSVAKISHHVYNSCNSFFAVVSYADIHRYVSQFLLRNSKNPDSIIRKSERGIYYINSNSQESKQLMLQFCDNIPEPEPKKMVEDQSLCLF